MREEVQKMGGKVAALQAHCKTLETEGERWQALWRSAAASNAQLTARVAALQDGQVRTRPIYSGSQTSATHWPLLHHMAQGAWDSQSHASSCTDHGWV